MRKVVYSMMVSLDGFVARPDGNLDWINIDEELHNFANDEAREMGVFLYGRRLYELMAGYWPIADQDPWTPPYMVEFARIWKAKPKVIFSRTLKKVDWNSRLAGTDIAEEISTMKAQSGGDMGVGGPELAASLMKLGLIDEFRLLVHPVVLGEGKPFFPTLDKPVPLKLIETRSFRSGVVWSRYERVPGGDQAS